MLDAYTDREGLLLKAHILRIKLLVNIAGGMASCQNRMVAEELAAIGCGYPANTAIVENKLIHLRAEVDFTTSFEDRLAHRHDDFRK